MFNINRLFLRNSVARPLCLRLYNSFSQVQETKKCSPLPYMYVPEDKRKYLNSESVHQFNVKSSKCNKLSVVHRLHVKNSFSSLRLHINRSVLDMPVPFRDAFQLPANISIDKSDITPEGALEAPPPSGNVEKSAARLIVIRRRKMKKHKLRKLRKKMKFTWAKVRLRRELRKEKAFQAELLAQIREAEKFDAAGYVAEKLRKAQEEIPRRLKDKSMPPLAKQKLGLKD